MSTIDRPRQLDVAARISAACSGIPHLADRSQIREQLAEAEAAEATRQQLEAELVALNSQLDALVEKHQADAQAIQQELRTSIPTKRRIKLRQDLQQLNANLQQECDELNRQIDACSAERDEAWILAAPVGQLRRRLEETADGSLLLEISVAENDVDWAEARTRAASKELASARFLDSQAANPPVTRKWDAQPRAKYNESDMAEIKQRLDRAEAEHQRATSILTEAKDRLTKLKQESLN